MEIAGEELETRMGAGLNNRKTHGGFHSHGGTQSWMAYGGKFHLSMVTGLKLPADNLQFLHGPRKDLQDSRRDLVV